MKSAKYFSATWCGPCKLIMDGDKEVSRIVGVKSKQEMIKELS